MEHSTHYSRKQWVYANNLLEQMGFNEIDYREKYLKEFFRKHRTYHETYYPPPDYDEDAVAIYYISNAITLLLKELDFKKNIQVQQKAIKNLSATAYSQYTFCPVSFSISNSYNIEMDKSVDVGLYLHGKQLLSRGIIQDAIREATPEFNSIFEKYPFNMIRESELIFSGHAENKHKYFHSNTGVRIGTPDYIFKDKHGKYFIVEEKTKLHSKATFREHHKIQLLSYLRIREYEITRGFLIYWLYEYYDKRPSITNAVSEELVLDNTSLKRLENIWREIKALISNGKMQLNLDAINEYKCVACKVSKYCFHKSKRYEKITFPYENLWV